MYLSSRFEKKDRILEKPIIDVVAEDDALSEKYGGLKPLIILFST